VSLFDGYSIVVIVVHFCQERVPLLSSGASSWILLYSTVQLSGSQGNLQGERALSFQAAERGTNRTCFK
jgi:hypothetical protein